MNALARLRRGWQAPFVRTAVLGAAGLMAFALAVLIAYELALARVPEHRAMLERLVRANTGLDIRFNELSLRWGWYGPEAVFSHVELGEPGQSHVLLRAPQLVVGFDAWRSVRSGQLQAGRITLVAPDVDLARDTRAHPAADFRGARRASKESPAALLMRWRGGRIEVQGGSLKLPDPANASDALTVQIRRASLKRSQEQWSASGLLFLPERLGRSARISAQWQGDLNQPSSLRGALRFDGLSLVFSGWRRLLEDSGRLARQLPAAGEGNVSFRVSFDRGRLEKAEGEVHAQQVSFPGPPWAGETQGDSGRLHLERLGADWRLAHQGERWQLRMAQLDFGTQRGAALPSLSLDVAAGGASVQGRLGDIPLTTLATLAGWLAPQLNITGIELDGIARNLRFSWNGTLPPGERLDAGARAENFTFTPASHAYALNGLAAELSAHEDAMDISLNADGARLTLAHAPEHPLEKLRLASQLRLIRAQRGWQLTTSRLAIAQGDTGLSLSGSIEAQAMDEPRFDIEGELLHADLALLRRILNADTQSRFGAAAAQLTGGRIERAQFNYRTGGRFKGSLSLRDARLAGGEFWPELQALSGTLNWNDDRLQASIENGRAGSITLTTAEAQWSATGAAAAQIAGEAHGRLDDAVQWLTAHPRLVEWAPQLQMLGVRGAGFFNFDISLPAAEKPARPRARVAVSFDDAQLRLAADVPEIQTLRGSLAFNNGRLQRSTLTAKWLGGPVSLRISERRAGELAVQAQGFLDARQLSALAGFDALPEVEGQTPWSGEFSWQPGRAGRAARWELQADASLIGIASRLPEPLAKSALAPMPLRIEADGAGESAELRIHLADRLRCEFALTRAAPRPAREAQSAWLVERGTVRIGSGATTVPGEPVIAVQGRVSRFDLPAYISLWQRAGNFDKVPAMVADLIAEQLWLADSVFPDVRVQGRKSAGAPPEVHLSASNLNEEERASLAAHLQNTGMNPIITLN